MIRPFFSKTLEMLIGDGSWFRYPAAIFHRYRGNVIEVDGVFLKMDRSLSNFMVNVLRRGNHDEEERALILPALEKNDVVMDLGGGIGHMSIRYAKIVGSERVFTFEANPELEPLMRENFRLNGVQPTAEFCMLGQKEGRESFVVAKHFWISSRDPTTVGKQIEVPVHPINERIRTIDPSFLVVDIEGGEREIFDGLDFRNIGKIMLEVHPGLLQREEIERIMGLIAKAGFSLQRREENCFLFSRRR